jgi:hypothetical protein
MRKITLSAFFIFSIFIYANAQLVLDFNTHAPVHGDVAHFFEVEFIEPGSGGKDMIWDFSDFISMDNFINSVHDNPQREHIGLFNFAPNVVLTEEDKQHFFILTPRTYQLVGLTTDKYVLTYEAPITRMQYPFTFNDYISSAIEAAASFNNSYHIDITGHHNVEADAYGLLILPGNRMKNVLRVKQVTHTTQVSMCGVAEVDNYKYTWFAADERYPLISTIIREERSGTGNNKLTQQTFINEAIYSCSSDENLMAGLAENSNSAFNYTVFPNPFRNDINISYQLGKDFNVNIGIFDILGQRVKDLVLNEAQIQGVYSYTISANEIGLSPGMYFVRFEIGNNVFIEKINRTH